MTQHIEEARKLKPAGYRRLLPQYGFAHYEFEQPDYENPSITDWEPLVLMSDVQAAIAAAEERGRAAERELCNAIVRRAWGQNVTIETLSEAITKEPTP